MTPVDLTDIQRVLEKYVDQHTLVAAGPLSAAGLTRVFVKNKLASLAVVGGGVWFAAHEVSASVLQLIQEQFSNLESILGSFRG